MTSLNNSNEKNMIDILIAESFKEIAKTKPIEKITIKEITDRAGVIRPTFYNHFQDKYQLLEWIVDNEIFLPVLDLVKNKKFENALMDMLYSFEEDKDFYMNAASLEGQNSFESILRNSIKKVVLIFLNQEELQNRIPYKWLTVEMLCDFYCEPLSYAVVDWIKSGMKTPKKDCVDGIIFVSTHSPVDVVMFDGKIL